MSELEIVDLIKYPNEERYLELKRSVSWDGEMRAKITKSIMAFANLKDGGWIVIGKEEQTDRSFLPVGMTREDLNSFDPDEMKAFVYGRAEPPVNFRVYKKEYEDKNFVLIQVLEFDEIPIICRKSYGDIIHAGTIYVRSKSKPESIPIPTQSEMREIIENAIDKGVKKSIQRLQRLGIWVPPPAVPTQDDEEKFAKQREESL